MGYFRKVLMQRLIIVRNDIEINPVILINAVEDYWKSIISVGKEEFGDGFSLGYVFPVDDKTFTYCINDDKIDLLKIANSYEDLIAIKDKAVFLRLQEEADFDFIENEGTKIGLWFRPLEDNIIAKLLKKNEI